MEEILTNSAASRPTKWSGRDLGSTEGEGGSALGDRPGGGLLSVVSVVSLGRKAGSDLQPDATVKSMGQICSEHWQARINERAVLTQ